MGNPTHTTSGASKRVFLSNRTDKDTHFDIAVAQNAQDVESILSFFNANKVEIWEITVISDIQRRYDLYFYGKSTADDATDIDEDTFIDDVEFDLPTSGRQIAAAGPYRMGMRLTQPIRYEDKEGKKQLHLGIIPRGGAKGVNDDIVIEIRYLPVFGGD